MTKALDSPIRYLKGIGPKRAKVLNKVGIETIEDLLYYFPRRYEDRTNFIPISGLQIGQSYTIKAEILAKAERTSFQRRGFSVVEVIVGDKSGRLFCVWFNRPYLKDYFKVGQSLILYGRVELYRGRLQMNSPEFEIILKGQREQEDGSLNIGRIIPIYSLPEGISQRNFRRIVKSALDEYLPNLNDFLPYDIRSRNNLLNLARSLINIHFPVNLQTQKEAYTKLSFDEFFLFQVLLALRKLKKKQRPGIAHNIEAGLANEFIFGLPFKLTAAQEKVIAEIKLDMARPQVMQRLLQGDVGSGKTVVATLTSLIAIQGGYQVAFMVPTEILAKQHYDKISYQLSMPTGRQAVTSYQKKIKIALLISSLSRKERDEVYHQIREGKIDLVIGTHALLEEGVAFKRLGLVVIDEQHKFGVGQRALLPRKGINPDVLIMTATPIPRTLAITLYGDMDISIINELPAGRAPIGTLHFSSEESSRAYGIAKEQLRLGHQVYIVYPVIEESYALDLSGAKKMYEELKRNEFRDYRLGLIHGRLKQKEQDQIMLKFRNKELDILVSTTVLEVGIDIPSATCMIIENAQRFGLAQLHQLRGRVGRGVNESFCVLVSSAQTEESKARIEVMVRYNDGFHIAEEDLKIRGPGEFFGQRQHGLCELRIANPLTQMQLLKKARDEAIRLVNGDPHLTARQNNLLREKILQRFSDYDKLINV